jgi:hypothetical protein
LSGGATVIQAELVGLSSPYRSGTRNVSPGVWIGRLSSSLWNCEPREYPSPDCWNGSARKSLSWTWGPFSDEVSGPTASRSGIGAVLAVGLAGGIGGTGSDRFGPLASRTRKGHAATMLPLRLMMRRAVARQDRVRAPINSIRAFCGAGMTAFDRIDRRLTIITWMVG